MMDKLISFIKYKPGFKKKNVTLCGMVGIPRWCTPEDLPNSVHLEVDNVSNVLLIFLPVPKGAGHCY